VFLGHLKANVKILTNEKITFWFANGETIKEICIVEKMCCCGRAETFRDITMLGQQIFLMLCPVNMPNSDRRILSYGLKWDYLTKVIF
jgi:hypothetical protein